MGNGPRSFRYYVHASHLYKGLGPCWFSGWVCQAFVWRKWWKVEHRWKIGWDDLLAGTSILEGVYWRCNKSKGIKSGANCSISWKDHHWEILKTGLLGHEQWGWVRDFLVGMAMVQKMGERTVEIFSNSRLFVGQVKGELEARNVRMQEYLN